MVGDFVIGFDQIHTFAVDSDRDRIIGGGGQFPEFGFVLRAFKERCSFRLQCLRNLIKAARANPVASFLVFLSLLEADSDLVSKHRLAMVLFTPSGTDSLSNIVVD